MENNRVDRGCVGESGIVRGGSERATERERDGRERSRGRDRCTRLRARDGDVGEGRESGNVRYNDVGSFTVVRHFGTCFPINMHVLVP